MFCAISGEPPTTPVVSKKSGLVFEQRLIKQYIADNGKDPVTGDALTEDDLIVVQSNPRTAAPRPPTMTSVPALLTSLQNEYDAVMFELFTLKNAYDNVRQELAHALYANDSASRVVARLLHERDEARAALASIHESIGQNGAAATSNARTHDAEMSEANANESRGSSSALPKEALEKVEETTKTLSSTRKAKLKRKPTSYPQAVDVRTFAQTSSLPSMHATKPAGVTALDVSLDGAFIVTGGRDKHVQLYNIKTDTIVATLKGHSKEITHVAFAQSIVGQEHGNVTTSNESSPPSYVLSASADNSVRIWRKESDSAFALAHSLHDWSASVTGLAVHPSGSMFAAASADGSWAVYDVASGERLLHVQTSHEFASLDIHPDGVLVAVGTNAGTVIVYDIRNGTESASFTSDAGTSSVVASLHFSENGYLLASATATLVEVWDLRKLSKAGTIEVQGKTSSSSSSSHSVRFDPSAQVLALVGDGARVYANKSWELLWTAAADESSSNVTDARWGWSDGVLLTSGLDRIVRSYGMKNAS